MSDKRFQENMMNSFIQIAAVVIIVTWCFAIIRPFIGMVAWALIIAVALYPAHQLLTQKLGGREKLSATIFVLLLLSILFIPTVYLADSTIEGTRYLATQLQSGSVDISPPDESVAEWPLIGSTVYEIWDGAARNLEATLNQYSTQLKNAGEFVVRSAGSTAMGILVFVISIFVAGVFLVSGESGYRVSRNIGQALSAEHGRDLIDMSVATIRSVAKGVLGVAIIQALLAAVGLVLIGVPAAGLWAFIILMLAIVQLPPLLVLAPIAVWVFSSADPVPATIFAVYAFVVSISDSFLKPLFLGRGMDIPMLVILIGAIGGAMTAGIIGLFIGAIVLAVGYTLLMAWIKAEDEEQQTGSAESAAGE